MTLETDCTHRTTICKKDEAKKIIPSAFLIRSDSGKLKWPYLNIYQSFEDSCREYNVIGDDGKLSTGVVNENLEFILEKRVKKHEQDPFQLGQIMFEKHRFKQAYEYFRIAIVKEDDPRAKYQLAVMIFDNLLDKSDRKIYDTPELTAIRMMEGLLTLDTRVGQPLGNEELVHAAAYNLAIAYQQGKGVQQSDEMALKYLLVAAEPGTTRTSVLAQTTLGYYFSFPEHMDLDKAFYWHTEACGNGSAESQAVIGVMYMFGLSVKPDWCASLMCLKAAANKHNTYAKGMLCLLYYQRKMFNNAASLGCEMALDSSLKSEIMRKPELNVFSRRGVSIACFIYACCLQKGLGVKQDGKMAKSMYGKSFDMDKELCSRFQNMVIRNEL